MAPWIEFTAPHDHRHASGAVTAYKPGRANVPQDVAARAIEAGRARPTKDEAAEGEAPQTRDVKVRDGPGGE